MPAEQRSPALTTTKTGLYNTARTFTLILIMENYKVGQRAEARLVTLMILSAILYPAHFPMECG